MNDAASAGLMIVVSLVLCGAVGLGLGSLFGAAVLTGLVGCFVGVTLGLWLVYTRFKNI
ncbi:MAG: hypothetical protein QOH13_391 [Thermoleophilaceae bacterium]|jgi:hypothetical protein|nr:hypothetical protein [Thermoleophilaceae bacterium]